MWSFRRCVHCNRPARFLCTRLCINPDGHVYPYRPVGRYVKSAEGSGVSRSRESAEGGRELAVRSVRRVAGELTEPDGDDLSPEQEAEHARVVRRILAQFGILTSEWKPTLRS